MAGGRTKLTARAAATTKPGRYGDGGGLYLVVSPSGARKWVYRFTYAGKVTETGLGSANVVSLAEARRKAYEARRLLDAGENPIVAKRKAAAITAGIPTFGTVADALVKAKESEWRNEKHKAQWRTSLTDLAAPLSALPGRRDRYCGRLVGSQAALAGEAGDCLSTPGPDRGGSRRSQSARSSHGGKPGSLARPPRASLAQARKTLAGPSRCYGLSGCTGFRC